MCSSLWQLFGWACSPGSCTMCESVENSAWCGRSYGHSENKHLLPSCVISFWPKRDVSTFIKTCHTCQLTNKANQTIAPAPLCLIPAISQPFEYLIIDCVGPLPFSKCSSQYLLNFMCQATRYPAAYPLGTITANSVVKALTQFQCLAFQKLYKVIKIQISLLCCFHRLCISSG